MDDTIHIFYPTYKNADVFAFVLNSCLTQDHKNIIVHVFDNSLADGSTEIQDACARTKDARVQFYGNLTNIGAAGNYNQILSRMKDKTLAVCLASDLGFAPQGLNKLFRALKQSGSPVVFGSTIMMPFAGINAKPDLGTEEVFDTLAHYPKELRQVTCSGVDVVKEYYSPHNINGEFNYFSIFGALIYGPILHSINDAHRNFKFHGYEHYLSMQLAWACPTITRLRDACLLAVLGAPRIGGTERPMDHYTRLEPIVACQRFLESKYFALKPESGSTVPLLQSQIDKCDFFEANYAGYKTEVVEIKRRCKAMLQ
jgi:glycosyltransferase involved in cell wall biosynthesis